MKNIPRDWVVHNTPLGYMYHNVWLKSIEDHLGFWEEEKQVDAKWAMVAILMY